MGTLLASAGIRLIRAFGPDNLPRLNEISLDLRVLGWALAISLLAGILVGLAPAIATLRRDCVPPARRVAEVSRAEHPPSNPPRSRGGGLRLRSFCSPAPAARPKLVEREQHRSGIQA